MQILLILICLAGAACSPQHSEHQRLEFSEGGLSHSEQTEFFSRASGQIKKNSKLRDAFEPLDNANYNVTAQVMSGADLAGLARGGIAIGPALGQMPGEAVAVVWGHPLKSSYWLIFKRDGTFLGAFVLPEG